MTISATWANVAQTSIICIKDGATVFVPTDPGNSDYQTILAWIAEGNAIAAYSVPFAAESVKAECSRRIYAIASQAAQMNMTAYIASGMATDADKSSFVDSLSWVKAMRAACEALISANDTSFARDSHWPACPADVLALVAKF